MEEKKYTLDEARRIVKREECERAKAHLDVRASPAITTYGGGVLVTSRVYCARCETEFIEKQAD